MSTPLLQLLFVDKPIIFTDTVIGCSASLPATSVATINITYVANAIQVRQTDAVGNVSDIGKNTLRIVVDNTNPIFDLQPATTVNVRVNSPDRPVSTKSNVGLTGLVISLFTDTVISCSVSLPC
jgi:hypothetical protein